MIDVLIMGGTWNPNGDGVTEAFARALDPGKFRASYVPYPADYGQRTTYADSVAAGKAALLRAIDDSPYPVIVAGYSQGAGIAGDFAAEIGRGQHPQLDVRAAALIADPARPEGVSITPDPGGFGISGQRHIPGIPAFHVAAWNDPITSLSPGSPLRTVADLSAYWNISNPEGFLRWGQETFNAVVAGRLQRWWNPAHLWDWTIAAREARGYLFDGRHTEAYVREGHCWQLAQTLNEEF
ncbi:PE-PPE domain-containing protein [Nocardia sp. IFM 10818]